VAEVVVVVVLALAPSAAAALEEIQCLLVHVGVTVNAFAVDCNRRRNTATRCIIDMT
jgi:hypothetical protein